MKSLFWTILYYVIKPFIILHTFVFEFFGGLFSKDKWDDNDKYTFKF
jgi:hypothetical protein